MSFLDRFFTENHEEVYHKEPRMIKTLIPRQRLSNFLREDDPNCLARCEIKNLFCYDWTFEVINLKTESGKPCYAFQLNSESLLGKEDKEVPKAECYLLLDRGNRNGEDIVEKMYNGGSLTMLQVLKDQINLHSVDINLELVFLSIHGYECLFQPEIISFPALSQVVLDVGGVTFKTTKATLTKYIGKIKVYLELENFIRSCRNDGQEVIFIDRSPKHFDLILNFMRNGELKFPESNEEVMEILREAKHYLMPDLIKLCTEHLESRELKLENKEIVSLDIGGTTFKTTRTTLTRFDGKFKKILENHANNSEPIFIDRCPKHFDLILNYMRDGDVDLPEERRELKEILREAQYYLLSVLVNDCQSILNNIND